MLDELIPPFNPQKIIEKKRALKRQLAGKEGLLEKRIALLSGSTIGEIKNILELFLLNYGIRPVFFEGQYGLFYEELMFGNKELSDFAPEVIYIHTSNKNIVRYPAPGMTKQQRAQLMDSTFLKWSDMWDEAFKHYQCVVIQNNFEMLPYRIMGNMDAVHENGRLRFLNDINLKMCEYRQNHLRFYVNDINYQSACFGLDHWFDMSGWYMYKYALALNAIPSLCHNIAAIIKAIFGKNKKALMLDLDNTLWGGVIGDDGADTIRLGMESPEGMAYAEFQQYLKAVSELGILLNVCSKNEEKHALEGFEHPSSVLKREDFACFKANWELKPKNIEAAAQELNLGLDSIVFADDNPAERSVVQSFLPQVETVALVAPETYVRTLDRQGYFETVALLDEDINRNKAYRENAQRQTEQARYQNYEDYLRSLDMVCRIDKFRAGNIARVTQLINKTNQFNLTTLRLSEAEVAAIADDANCVTMCGQLIDKFGDNGIVCVLYARKSGENAAIELFLMSCRVFKRGLEQVMLCELIRRLKHDGVKMLQGSYLPTKKNDIVRDFYIEQGFKAVSEGKTVLNLDNFLQNNAAVMEIEYHDAR